MSNTHSSTKNSWAVGATVFAGSLMMIVGFFQFFQGLVAVIDGDEFLVRTDNYLFTFDATTWGWIHLVLGLVVGIAGFFVLTGNIVARSIAILLVSLSAIANFLWLPYYPVWSIVIIAIDVLVIWGLATVRLDRD